MSDQSARERAVASTEGPRSMVHGPRSKVSNHSLGEYQVTHATASPSDVRRQSRYQDELIKENGDFGLWTLDFGPNLIRASSSASPSDVRRGLWPSGPSESSYRNITR